MLTRRRIWVLTLVLAGLVHLTVTSPIRAYPIRAQSIRPVATLAPNAQSGARPAAQTDYPPDLPGDIEWSAGRSGLSDVEEAFNHAREREKELLGVDLPAIHVPAADEWDQLSDGEKALWLINQERTARGLPALQGLEPNVGAVAQSYAEWLLAHNQFDHDADGRTPWERLEANPTIAACHDFLAIAENLYFIATTGDSPLPLVIEQAVYVMLYADAGSAWGHRHAILWTPYTENSGAPDREGFLGIGHAHGGYTVPDNGIYYQNSDIVVMDFFDPCATWAGSDEATSTPTPTATVMPTTSPTPNVTPSATPTATPSPTPDPPDATVTPVPTPNPERRSRTVSGKVIMAPAAVPGSQPAPEVGMGGVTITSDDGQMTTTDANGDFTLVGLSRTRHTLFFSKADYAFAPPTVEVDLRESDVTGLVIAGSAGATGTDLAPGYTMHMPLIRNP